jgi:hypothetical protein
VGWAPGGLQSPLGGGRRVKGVRANRGGGGPGRPRAATGPEEVDVGPEVRRIFAPMHPGSSGSLWVMQEGCVILLGCFGQLWWAVGGRQGLAVDGLLVRLVRLPLAFYSKSLLQSKRHEVRQRSNKRRSFDSRACAGDVAILPDSTASAAFRPIAGASTEGADPSNAGTAPFGGPCFLGGGGGFDVIGIVG